MNAKHTPSETMTQYTGTYSPDDNKLRLYASSRLDAELYARVKETGFKWAPKQGLFVAPMWTPARADLLIELCGEIGDEDTSLTERAEERADRFENYSDKRSADADRAYKNVSAIAENIPFGQPILIGHHSEKRARKDAKRIEDGMRNAVNMWDTAQYWTNRAAGAVRAAKYKERPEVRARRIKGIQADKRKSLRAKQQVENSLKTYRDPEAQAVKFDNGRPMIHALLCAWGGGLSYEHQRQLEREEITLQEALDLAVSGLSRIADSINRWIEHYGNRLAYEVAMLDEQCGADLLKPKPRKEQLPLINYRAPDGLTIANIYHRGEFIHYPQIEMTKAEYSAINIDYKGTREVEGSHRVRTAAVKRSSVCVFLTDSKIHAKPTNPALAKEAPPLEIEAKPETISAETGNPEKALRSIWTTQGVPEEKQAALIADISAKAQPGAQIGPWTIPEKKPGQSRFDALRDMLKEGVQVVSAPQLFPTPLALAARMVELAEIEPGHSILEPSGGSGRIVRAIRDKIGNHDAACVAVEIKPHLAAILRSAYRTPTHCADFLALHVGILGTFDRIIMNPPFVNAEDIKHIQHAAGFLNPGGRLVSICANGPRQFAQLRPLASTWEELPPGTFAESGTMVNTVLLVIDN